MLIIRITCPGDNLKMSVTVLHSCQACSAEFPLGSTHTRGCCGVTGALPFQSKLQEKNQQL